MAFLLYGNFQSDVVPARDNKALYSKEEIEKNIILEHLQLEATRFSIQQGKGPINIETTDYSN
jgi:hypothetical protein